MRKKFGIILVFTLLGSVLIAPNASSAPTSFVASRGSAADFDGERLRFTNSSGINMGGSDFTISWWQKTTDTQTLYPRLMQFGAGVTYKESFAISEESDGKIYLWIKGNNVTNLSIPLANNWNHIALTRTNGNTFRWFLDGLAVRTTIDPNIEPFDTSGLDLLLGGGDDVSSGTFNGQIAGFQISQSVRWPGTTTFTPPVDFQTPDSGLAFSMYGSETTISDLSTNFLAVNNPAVTVIDWNPSPTPDPDPTPDPELPWYEVDLSVYEGKGGYINYQQASDDASDRQPSKSALFEVQGDETFTINLLPAKGQAIDFVMWNDERIIDPAILLALESDEGLTIITDEEVSIEVYYKLFQTESKIYKNVSDESDYPYFNTSLFIKSEDPDSPNDYTGLDGIIMAFPVTISEAQVTTCYMDITTFVTQYPYLGGLDHPQVRIKLPEFSQFFGGMEFFPEDCSSPRSEAFPEGEIIPMYRPGLLGQESMTATFALFSQLPEDLTDASTAIERLTVTLALPPDILSYTITSADPAKAGSGEIYFGDTVTVTVTNSINAESVFLAVALPEAISLTFPNEPKLCFIEYILSDENSYRFPTPLEFMSTCRVQWDGEWELDRVTDHSFVLAYADYGDNIGYPLVLNIPALEAPTPEPDPTAPPTPEPDPPKVIIPPTPPAPEPPTPPAPNPPAPNPPAPTPVPYLKTLTTPKLNLKDGKLICTPCTYNAGYTLDGVVQGSGTTLFTPSAFTYNLLINGIAQTSLAVTNAVSTASWNLLTAPSGAMISCSVTVSANGVTNTDMSTDNTSAVSSALSAQALVIAKANTDYSMSQSANSKAYQKALVDNRAKWRSGVEKIRTDYYAERDRIKSLPATRATRALASAALKAYSAAQRKSATDYRASQPAALAARDAANNSALDAKGAAIAKANAAYGTFIESIGYGVLIP
jgi:Skp family chaperone for outer membrane proteins